MRYSRRARLSSWVLSSFMFSALMQLTPARAVPGPDSVMVLYQSDDPESEALANRYAEARWLPAARRCGLSPPREISISLETFEEEIYQPLLACLDAAGEELEALLLTRGLPLQVRYESEEGALSISLAALLAAARSEEAGVPLWREVPATLGDCGGTPCWYPRFENPWRAGSFSPGWERREGALRWRLWLVTRLDGYDFDAAEALRLAGLDADGVESEEALAARRSAPVVLMAGADPARGVLDREYDAVEAALQALGQPVERWPFDGERSHPEPLAAFVTGSASLGEVIEGNRFAPGAIVDNLTSYGAVPANFDRSAEEVQVSVSRWVERGPKPLG